jgi:hypothetical protein
VLSERSHAPAVSLATRLLRQSNMEIAMRRLLPLMLLMPLVLAACGTTKKTTIVNAPPDTPVIVQPNGDVVVKPDDDRNRDRR